MNLEDRIRAALGRAGRAYDPGGPPLEDLAGNIERRRRRKLATAGGGLVVAVAVLVGAAVALPDDPTPEAALDATGQPVGSSTTAYGDPSSSTAPLASSSSSPSANGTIAPSGTAYSPPASFGGGPTPTTVAPPVTTTPPTSGDTVTVTAEDNGKTVTLRRGQHLVVSLSDPGWTWSEPDTDNANVLKRTAVSANPSSDHVTASFDAIAGGQAHVSAGKDAACRQSNPPCMVPTYLWQVTVNVA